MSYRSCSRILSIFVFAIYISQSANLYAEELSSKCLSNTDTELRMKCYMKSIEKKIIPTDDRKQCVIEVFNEYCLGGMYKRNSGDINIDGVLFKHQQNQNNLNRDVFDILELSSNNVLGKVQHIDIGDSDFFLQLLGGLERHYGKPVDLSSLPARVKEKSVRENSIYILSGSYVYQYVWSLPEYGVSLSLRRHNKKVISSLIYIIK